MNCPECGISSMIAKPFGYYQCRLVDMKYQPKNIDLSLFNPKCLLLQKLG